MIKALPSSIDINMIWSHGLLKYTVKRSHAPTHLTERDKLPLVGVGGRKLEAKINLVEDPCLILL